MFFDFESDFIQSMRCIPMVVRYKLDTCGIKLKLEHWLAWAPAERHQVTVAPTETPAEQDAYRELVQRLVMTYHTNPAKPLPIDPHPAWLDTAAVPDQLQAHAATMGTEISVEQWRSLTPLQRFALIKLSRPSHENKNFPLALQEFGLSRSV